MTDSSSADTPTKAPQHEAPFDVLELMTLLWGQRWLIAKVTGAVTILTLVVSFVLPEYYRSTAILLPEGDKSKLGGLGGLSDLASLAGVNVGGNASNARLYPTIIRSESILRKAIESEYEVPGFTHKVNLIQFWDIEEATPQRNFEVALKKLRDDLEVNIDNKTSVVTVALETRDPRLTSDVLNTIIRELDVFISTSQRTNASEQRKWVEERLGQVENDLRAAEEALKSFRERNRRVSDSPLLLMTQERLLRDIEIHSTVFVELRKQLELARIEEVKNVPIINVLDRARPAAKREWPRRGVMTVLAFLLSLSATAGYVVVRHRSGDELVRFLKGLRSSPRLRT